MEIGDRGRFVHLPLDKFGNTAYGTVVIEAEAVEAYPPGSGYISMKVLAPPEFAQKWPKLSFGAYGQDWCATDHEPATLSREEWKAVVDQVDPEAFTRAADPRNLFNY